MMSTDNDYYLRGFFKKVSKDTDQTELSALRRGHARAASGVIGDSISEALSDHYSSRDGLAVATWQSYDNTIENASSQISGEIAKRAKSLGDLYPFRLDKDVLIYHKSDSQLYEFLLCASLSPSLTDEPYCRIPRYFERIATELTANYLGPNSHYCHIGWPNSRGRFKNSVEPAIVASKELSWGPDNDLPDDGPRSGDQGVDYILWKSFGCGRNVGQPFYFGQCACGNDWDTKLNDISTRFFRWFARLKVPPVKVFAVPFVLPEGALVEASIDAGIIMDRLRLVHALPIGSHYNSNGWRNRLAETLRLVVED